MGVPKWRRSSSKLDAFYEAVKLRQIVTQMVMRSYGMKTGNYKRLVPKKVRAEYPDLAKLFDRVDKYQEQVEETGMLEQYDNWMITKTRSNLLHYSSLMVGHITSANEIRCTIKQEYVKRILLQDDAITDVANIKQEVQFVEEFFAIDLNKYMCLAEQLEKVRNYLYRWKRSTVNEYKEFLKNKQEEQNK